MANLGYLLMTELHSEATAADENYERKSAFEDAENMVNNFLHGRSGIECLTLTKKVIVDWISEGDRSDEEKLAFGDALIILDILAEQYDIAIV